MRKRLKQTRETTYKNQAALSGFHFVTEFINLLIVIFTVIKSGSLIIWLDLINSLGNTLRVGLMVLFSRKMVKTGKQMSNYDTHKAEAMIAFFCNCLVFVGLIATFILSVIRLIHPTGTDQSLIWAIIFKFFCALFDLPILIAQYKIRKSGNNQVTNSGFMGALTAFLFDVVALLSVCIVFITREMPGSEYVSPVLSIAIAIFLIVVCIREILKSIHTITDKNIPEDDRSKILQVISESYDDYKYFDSVQIHYKGTTVCVDISITVSEDMPYSQIKQMRKEIQQDLEEIVDNCVVTMIIT